MFVDIEGMSDCVYFEDAVFLDPDGRWLFRLSLMTEKCGHPVGTETAYCFRVMQYDLNENKEIEIPDQILIGENKRLDARGLYSEKFFELKRRGYIDPESTDYRGSVCVLRSVESDKHIYGISLDGDENVVLCKNNFGVTDKFDIGQEYVLLNETDEFLVVEDKFGEQCMCNKDRFKRKLVLT